MKHCLYSELQVHRTEESIPNRCYQNPARSFAKRGSSWQTVKSVETTMTKLFIEAAGVRYTFDSFECAIHAMAPICEHCQCRVIGHRAEVKGHFFCCAHCAKQATSADVRDRVA